MSVCEVKVCSKCAFYVQDEHNFASGECRRFPPTTLLGQINDNEPCYTISHFGIYPLVEVDGWCGEWAPSDETWKQITRK